MNNELMNEVAQAGGFKSLFGLDTSAAAIASKASFGDAVTVFLTRKLVMDAKVTTASTNVNGVAGNKDVAQGLMAGEWAEINGDARVYARPRDLGLFEKVKFTKPQFIKMGDVASYGSCEAEWLALNPLVGTTDFPAILTHLKLDAAKARTATFKEMVGSPRVAHGEVNAAIKYLMETSVPANKVDYVTFADLSISMAHDFPDFVVALMALMKEHESGIQHRGFTIEAKSSVDASLIHGIKIEFTDYVNVKEPVFTNSMGNSGLITMRIGQWTIRCSKVGWVMKEFKPVFQENVVTHFEMVFTPA